MAVVTLHPNTEVDIDLPSIDGVVGLDAVIEQQIDDLIYKIGLEKKDIFESLIDGEDGIRGRISKLISVYKDELDNLLADKKIDKEQYGLAIVDMLKMSTEYAYRTSEYSDARKDTDAESISKLIQLKVDLLRLSATAQKAVFEAEDIRFKTRIINPLTRENMKEDIERKHIDHRVQNYNFENMLPIEKDKLLTETNTIKFELNSMKPQQLLDMKEKVLASIADRKVQEYYQSNIQPCEKRLTCAKASIEEINSGIGGGLSLPAAKLEQIGKQTDLYQAEIDAYADRRRQKLLETIVNYHSMIFPDLPLPKAFDWAVNETNGSTLYTLLKT